MPYYGEKDPGVKGKRSPKYRYGFSCLEVRGGSLPSKYANEVVCKRRGSENPHFTNIEWKTGRHPKMGKNWPKNRKMALGDSVFPQSGRGPNTLRFLLAAFFAGSGRFRIQASWGPN